MNCPSCKGTNFTIEMVQSGGRTRKHGTGFGGNFNNAARGVTALSTAGLSNLVWKKSKGTERAKFTHKKIALCQSCGTDWPVK